MLFSISCSNEGTTGGNTGDDYWYNPETNNNDITPPPVTPGKLTASATKNITINILNQKVYSNSAGNIGFVVSPSELQNTGNFTVSIESVTNAAGNTNPLTLKPDDFITNLTPTTKELTLSDKGLDKVNTIKTLEDATAYKYDVTFKFTTTSDTVSNKTALYTSTVSLIKVVTVTKDMLEKMINSTPKLTVTNRRDFDGFDAYFEINFSALTLTKEIIIGPGSGGMTGPTRANSTFSPTASGLTNIQFGTAETSKFIFSSYYKTHTLIWAEYFKCYISLNLNYIFTLKEGYILDDSISFITNDGINLLILFSNTGEWKED